MTDRVFKTLLILCENKINFLNFQIVPLSKMEKLEKKFFRKYLFFNASSPSKIYKRHMIERKKRRFSLKILNQRSLLRQFE